MAPISSPWLKFLTKCTLDCLLEIGGSGIRLFFTAGSLDCRVVQFRPKGGGAKLGVSFNNCACIVAWILHVWRARLMQAISNKSCFFYLCW